MAIRIVRLGDPRARDEGLRIGTVRRLPRGVRKSDYARLDYFDLWLPELSPSAGLFAQIRASELSDTQWARFAAKFRREMQQPAARRLLALLARMSQYSNFSVGCYCEVENRCHRSLLRKLLLEHKAKLTRP